MRQQSSSYSRGASFTGSPDTVQERAPVSSAIAPQAMRPASSPPPPRRMSASVFASSTASEKGFVT